MSLQNPIATSFNGGELSPRMGGRIDTAIYQVGLAEALNFVPTVEGAIVKRPGFEYIREAAASASWLSQFRFNLTQDYVIEWSEGRLRFYTNEARIETAPGVPYEVAVPYRAADAPFLSCQQSFDRLYIDHPAYPPARLNRTSATTFTYEVLSFRNGPFADGNADQARTLTASATTGEVTLTANVPIFAAGHIGAPFRIEAIDFSTIPAWEAQTKGIVAGDVRRSEGKAYTAQAGGTTGTVVLTHTTGTEWDGSNTLDANDKGPFGIPWTYRHDRFGMVRIDAVAGDGLSATAMVTRTLPDSVTSVTSVATWRWAHGAFSAAAGWPGVVIAWAGRLCHFKQSELLASVAGDYLNHAAFTASGIITGDLAFRRTLATEDAVLWALGDRKLIVGTASREIAIGAINAAQAVGGDNIDATPQSFYGSERVYPAQIATTGVFVQRGGRKLRQAEYDFGRDRYQASNMTVWCRHITRSGVRQLAFAKEPEELLVGVRGDGVMIVHPHAPEQETKGFARIEHAGGRMLSVVSCASSAGDQDALWVLVDRDGVKSVERMAAWHEDGDPIADTFYVDSGTTVIAAAGQTRFTGATHLAGRAVAVLADGGVVSGVTVAADGSFSVPATSVPDDRAYRLTVGLAYTARAVTLRPELGGRGNTSQGKRQRLVRLVLRLIETSGIRIGALDGKLDNLIDRSSANHMDAPVPLFTGDTDRAVSGGWDRNGQAVFESSGPLPATIVAAMPTIVVTE